jgi:hypothetical protein
MTTTKEPQNPLFYDFKGDLLTVIAASPLPPGSRVAFPLNIPGEDNIVSVQGKVVCATPLPEDAPTYRISVRVHSLPKADRDALLAAISAR